MVITNNKVKLKKTGEIVEFISADLNEKKALIWSNTLASHQNGNGWRIIKLNELRPINWVVSKTDHNELTKIKLVDAVFECSDGMRFTNNEFQSVEEAKMLAQEHEYDLIQKQEEDENE